MVFISTGKYIMKRLVNRVCLGIDEMEKGTFHLSLTFHQILIQLVHLRCIRKWKKKNKSS